MKTVHLTMQEGKILIDQDYDFVISDDIYFTEDLTPYKEVKFNWNLQLVDLVENSREEKEEVLRQIGEKIKQDFIAFMLNQDEVI